MIKAVFFDYFDTLVHRNCNAETILVEWAKKEILEFRLSYTPVQLYKYRKEVEKKIKETNGIESCYSDLVGTLFDLYITESNVERDYFVKKTLEIEEQLEIEHQFMDTSIMDLINKYRDYDLYVVSDFYMPSCSFLKFLKHFKHT